MLIEYAELTIRNAEASDAVQLAEWWNDGEVMAHAGFPLGLGTTPEKIAGEISGDSDDTRRRLVLVCGSVSIGEMSYKNIGNHTAEIGIKICRRDMQNRGLGRRYLSMLISRLFEMGYEKIVLDTDTNNKRAQHVYESLGFRCVGVRENCFTDQIGVMRSAVDYELILRDFVSFLK